MTATTPILLKRHAGPLTLLATGLGMLWWTWGAWPDPLVDFGRELYVPWRLAEGDVLFREVAWFNGPFSPHWNGLLFRVFGPGLSVLVWANALVLAACVAMLYTFVLRMSDRTAATAACLLFLLVFAFGQYVGIANYNWIAPYSHEATHGVALALAAVAALVRWHRTGSLRFAALGGLALGLCFLTKPETFLAGSLGSAVIVAAAVHDRDRRAVRAFAAAMLAPVLLSLAVFGARGTLGAWPHVLDTELSRMPYYLSVTGLDLPAERIAEVLAWGSVWLLALLALGAAGWLARETRGPVVPLLIGALVLGGGLLLGERFPWADVLRPLPIFLAALAIVLLVRMRGTDREGRPVAALALTALSLGLLAKVVLHVRVAHYGFVLAMPGCLLAATALLAWLPRWLDARGIRGDVLRMGVLALLAAFAVDRVATTGEWLATKTQTVGSGRDAFRSDLRGAFVNLAVAHVEASGAGSLSVLPEGVMINYLARTPNPTPYINFMPPEEVLFGDAAWTAAFSRSPPELVAFVPKDLSEFARGPFGVGYGRQLSAYIASEYALRSILGIEGVAFEIRILERAPSD